MVGCSRKQIPEAYTEHDVRLIVATLLIGALLVTASCGGSGSPGGSGALTTISSVDQFKRAFDEGAGHPRLVLLLSPT
jgi:hypothetical protein